MIADSTSTAISLTIGVGALIAFIGEMLGVIRNAHSPKARGMETITEYVRWAVRHSVVARIAVLLFTVSLVGHFQWGGPLLP